MTAASVNSVPPSDSKSVLVLDDDPSVHRFLERMLRLHGFKPRLASTVRETITAAESLQVAAFILDVRLRGDESGLDVLAWLRSTPRYASVPVLMLTGLTHLSEDEEAIIRKDRAYVFYKPEKLHLLIDQLKRLVP
jgi:two-component system response regulator VanR/two-component system response regulator Irr